MAEKESKNFKKKEKDEKDDDEDITILVVEDKDEDDEEEKNVVGKAVSISLLNSCIELKSEDPNDNLKDMVRIATKILDKYTL